MADVILRTTRLCATTLQHTLSKRLFLCALATTRRLSVSLERATTCTLYTIHTVSSAEGTYLILFFKN
jgi:hypothetical protein